MARIPPLRNLRLEDFPSEQRSWLGTLISPISQFMTLVISALTNQLTISENFLGQIKTFDNYILTTLPSPTAPLSWTYPFASRPKGVIAIECSNITTGTPIGAPVYVEWTYVSGSINIVGLTGVTAGDKYRLSFLVLGG